jgi:hypothetical protein
MHDTNTELYCLQGAVLRKYIGQISQFIGSGEGQVFGFALWSKLIGCECGFHEIVIINQFGSGAVRLTIVAQTRASRYNQNIPLKLVSI